MSPKKTGLDTPFLGIPRVTVDALESIIAEMRAALEEGDYARSLRAADDALRLKPGFPVALMCKLESSRELEALLVAKIGPLSRVPFARDDAGSLDAHARAVLSLVDGRKTIADVVDGSGMDRIGALRVVGELIARGFIGVGA